MKETNTVSNMKTNHKNLFQMSKLNSKETPQDSTVHNKTPQDNLIHFLEALHLNP